MQESQLQEAKQPTMIDKLLDLKEKLEKDFWIQKTCVKGIEIFAFLGMFLCENPIGYKTSVVIAALAVFFDFWLGYKDYVNQKAFEKALN